MQPGRALCHGFRAWALHHGFWARALCHGSVGFASPPQADGPAFCRTISRPIIGPTTQKKTLQLRNNNTLEVKDTEQQDLETLLLGAYGEDSGRLRFSGRRFCPRPSPHLCVKTSGAYCLGAYTSRATDFGSGEALTCPEEALYRTL